METRLPVVIRCLKSYISRPSIPYLLNPLNKAVFIFVLEGAVTVAGKKIGKRDAIGIWETDQFTISIEQEADFIVIEVPVNH